MFVWISGGLALLLWVLLVYFFGGQYRASGRLMESERVEKEAAQMFETEASITTLVAEVPRNAAYALKWLEMAAERQDRPEVIRRSKVMIERFPQQRMGYLWLARGLWQSGKVAESQKVLRQMKQRYGKNAGAADIVCNQAYEAKDYRRSAKLAARVRKTYPDAPEPYRNEVRALLALNAFEHAEQVVLLAEKRFPDSKLVPELWDLVEAALAEPEIETPAP